MPLSIFKRLVGKPEAAGKPFEAELSPDDTIHAVGDIHGRADLLDRMLATLDSAQARRIVFLGDYVDRGEQSRDVVARLFELSTAQPDHVTCLMGNHEKMMLDFLDSPGDSAGRWLRNGGLQTLASFGIGGIGETPTADEAEAAAASLSAALGVDLESWLRTLPRQTVSGNVHFVHAAADPAVPMTAQDPKHLIWGHPAFFGVPRSDGQWVVHGHTVVDHAVAENGRIAVDTGAWFTGRLTAARVAPDGVGFVTC